ncbi:hypothetical protein PM082_019350 [Marasmius tenuissimus]|nr:hypothetical protein PM082_019350 [Marasmius tenuissimus]
MGRTMSRCLAEVLKASFLLASWRLEVRTCWATGRILFTHVHTIRKGFGLSCWYQYECRKSAERALILVVALELGFLIRENAVVGIRPIFVWLSTLEIARMDLSRLWRMKVDAIGKGEEWCSTKLSQP